MKALLYGAVCALGLLGAVGAQAHDRGDWHDHGWHRGWQRDYRPYVYAPRYCPPRYRGWHEGYYYREAYPRYGYVRPRSGAEVVLSFPLY